MPIDLAEFHNELFQDVHGRADAQGMLVEDTFFEVFTEPLVDAASWRRQIAPITHRPEESASTATGAIRSQQTAYSA